MLNVKRIILSADELEQCIEFSKKSAPNQQAIEFGQQSTTARSNGEIARDNLIGKIAEVAFSKMLKENYGLTVPLDFNYYPRGQWDNQDAVINGWRIDVKGTRKGGQWLLIEWNKLVFRQKDDNLSHLFVMFSVDWDRETDSPTGIVSYQGAVSLGKLNTHTPSTAVLRKGTYIPGTHTRLQADNYGIRFKDLYKHLNHLVDRLTSAPPPKQMTENFENPYTGETTKHIKEQRAVARNTATQKVAVKNSLFERFRKWVRSFLK